MPRKLTFILTRSEILRLYDEIGDIPKSYVGPKLLELYRRLDNALGPEENENGTSQKEEDEEESCQ
jgi:hypothetical protein